MIPARQIIRRSRTIERLNEGSPELATSISFQQTVYCTDIFTAYVFGGAYTLSATSLTDKLEGQYTGLGVIKTNQIAAILYNANLTGNVSRVAAQVVI